MNNCIEEQWIYPYPPPPIAITRRKPLKKNQEKKSSIFRIIVDTQCGQSECKDLGN